MPDSFVRNCLVLPREDDVTFIAHPDRVEARLDGYAIVPREYLEALERLVLGAGVLPGEAARAC